MPDVLAAIQVLGTYEFAARELDKWARRPGREPRSARSWLDVFKQHPEFFTIDDTSKIALVWRRSVTRDYDTFLQKQVAGEELEKLRAEEKKGATARLSRMPLSHSQIELLCNLAINLHESEIKHRQEKRWWVTAIVGIIVAVISVTGPG